VTSAMQGSPLGEGGARTPETAETGAGTYCVTRRSLSYK
jgi:hypothetical protein